MKFAKIGALSAVLAIAALATGCAYNDPIKSLDASCAFKKSYFEPVGEGEVKVMVYSCDQGEVEIKLPR